jgi:hypothetical protein
MLLPSGIVWLWHMAWQRLSLLLWRLEELELKQALQFCFGLGLSKNTSVSYLPGFDITATKASSGFAELPTLKDSYLGKADMKQYDEPQLEGYENPRDGCREPRRFVKAVKEMLEVPEQR